MGGWSIANDIDISVHFTVVLSGHLEGLLVQCGIWTFVGSKGKEKILSFLMPQPLDFF